jgi:hypothetical protein
MVYRSRRWRLLIRAFLLVIASVLMLLFAGPVTYALQADEPQYLDASAQLYAEDRPLDGKYVQVEGKPDLLHAFATDEILTTYYWIPVQGYDRHLLIRTDDPQYLFPYDYDPQRGFIDASEVQYTGKALPLKTQMSADTVVEELAARGVPVDKEKVVLLSQGEIPSRFRPMVPVMPALAWVWLAALVGLIRIARRRPRYEVAGRRQDVVGRM